MERRGLNSESASPLYRQLIQRLRSEIAAGVYPVHSRIPSEQELGEAYQVSRVTVRKALAELTRDGLLQRRQGKGTFVCAPRISQQLRDVNSFHEACRVQGSTPGTKVIGARIVQADEETCAALHLTEPEAVEIVRLRLADDEPVMLETNRFPMAYAWLLQEQLEGSLYRLLEAHGVEPARGIHEISLCHASPAQAKLLAVNGGDALMQLDQVICDAQGTPIHTSHQVIRGDRFTFRI